MTDNEIKKGLELTIDLILNNKISQLNDEQKHHTCFILASALDAIDVKNEAMQAAINGQETLQEYIAKQDKEIKRMKANEEIRREIVYRNYIDDLCVEEKIKAEAYKEFAENVQGEIDDAIHSNYNAKEERIVKSKKLGISIDAEDSFLMYCDGKIHALSGINEYIDNLLKELVGEDNAKNIG